MRRRSAWWLVAPGAAWLAAVYVAPAVWLAGVSLQEGSLERGYRLTWRWRNYADVLARYDTQLLRSLLYALAATAICLAIAYPLAYTIALRAGRAKGALVFLVILPFFVSLVIRTLSWRFVLSDEGLVLDLLHALGVGDGFRLLATPGAVIGGLVYDFLPFMTLPLVVALSRIDRRTLEAAGDLYASRLTRFRTVTLPLSRPGIVAGCLLTFVPAAGDYVHAELLGGPGTTMIGTVVQREFLVANNHPAAAALAFVLLAAILVVVLPLMRLTRAEELAA